MVIPEKTYTDNPFVDNVIYYAKLMAMNCSVKDEEEALANETKETLEAGDILIACVESNSTYEQFKYIPKEILEKYIPVYSNLDLYVDNPDTLRTHLMHYGVYERTALYNTLSKIAREVYMDHYDIMTNYITTIGESWADDNKALYDNCVNGSATYKDLFDIMPVVTRTRIIKQYLNNFDISKLDDISASVSAFDAYIDTRTDMQISTELDNISKAMRDVFISHYNIMVERRYIKQAHDIWYYNYTDLIDAYVHCKRSTATYSELYDLFPHGELLNSLNDVFGESIVSEYRLDSNINNLEQYLSTVSSTPAEDKVALNANMSKKYMANYNAYSNYSTCAACRVGVLNYFDLVDHLPKETQKMIINTQIQEVTNLQVFEENKQLLNNYLQTLPESDRINIKQNINKDMRIWYPEHHEEYNNYYRSLIGLPPVDKNNKPYEDTLIHSYNPITNTYIEFGDRFIKQLPTGIYPEIHWKQNICDFDSYDVGILNQYGILEEYVTACGYSISDSRYRYLRYLGDNKLSLYQCRKALKFQLIGIPTVDDTDAQKRFVDYYAVNRDYVIRTVYSDAHKFQSDYYDKFMIIFILINTIIDMLSSITTMIIDREVFDSRCIKWLFESFGVPYYSEIPIKYLRAMLKNLNLLLKYKSSTRNMIDICNLFGFSDVRVFGYYLFKERIKDSNTGEYEFNENNNISYNLEDLWVKDPTGETQDYSGVRYTKLLEYRHYSEDEYTQEITYQDYNGNINTKSIIKNDADVYVKDPDYNDFLPLSESQYFTSIKAETAPAQLKFIKVPIDEELTEYKNDPNYIIPYDEITYNDEGDTWDGGLDHDQLYQDLVDYEFNAVKTKYISVETVTDLTEQSFQVAYFYNMLFDNMYSEESLTVKIPYIKIGHNFRFMDVICYLFALMYFYNGLEDKIMYSPTQILYIKGYNFNEALNEIMNDERAFTQEPDLAYRENIFDVNEQIAQDNYDYRQAFEGYKIKGFNLEADIDEIEKWLNEECQMSLSDFIVDDSLTDFSQVITLRQFFTLKNSYYQKDIFQDNVAPLPYNQNIKSAYGIELYEKFIENDLDEFPHKYITDNGNIIEIIDESSDELYIIYRPKCIEMDNYTKHTILLKYVKSSQGNYIRSKMPMQYYYYNNNTNTIERLFDDEIYIVDNFGRYIFATNAIYQRDPVTDTFSEVTDERYFIPDKYESNRRCLLFGEYWVKDDNGNWIIDPNQAYVWVEINGVDSYMPWNIVNSHENIVVSDDDCWVKHSDGHFIKYTETDYYINNSTSGENTNFELKEEVCYVVSSTPTDESDTDLNGITRYFKKLSDYYYENNWIYKDDVFVYDSSSQSYIPQSDLLSPSNCYFCMSPGVYGLVIDNCAKYVAYSNVNDVPYILVRQDDNDYIRYALENSSYVASPIDNKRYIYNSDTDYITALLLDATYEETKSMVVVFNREVTSSNANQLDTPSKYNPEETDKVWDENDWFYPDEAYANESIGMHGENIWYYRKPGSTPVIEEDAETEDVGSGFYMASTAYIGDIKLEKGQKYYMAFDIETNFTGTIQIYNTADSSVETTNDKTYEVVRREKQHISQVFIANDEETPEIRFLKYDFENYPIYAGDYIIVSNIKFIKAYSDNFISQDIPSYDKLQEIYRTNEAIYKYLTKLMAEESDYHMYSIYKKLYDSLMISKYNKEAFKISDDKYAKTYTEFLENRDAILYAKLARFKSLDPDAMHKEIADEIIEVTYAIDGCVDTYTYGFLYSYFPAVSASYIQQYITKIINWFKSWKVHLLGINTVYKLGDPLENTIKILEGKLYKIKYPIDGNVYIHHTAKINPLDDVNISGIPYKDLYEFDKYTHEYEDKTRIRDRVRIISRTANRIEYTDSETELHLVFNDDEIMVGTEDTNILNIKSSTAGFATANTNDLVMSTEENEQQAFAHQVIDEINKLSGDYIEWRDLLDE